MIFKKGVELKPYVSGLDATVDLANVNSAILDAQDDIIDIIGEEIFAQAESYYTTPPATPDTVTSQLVVLIQAAVAPLAIHKHFIWLAIRVGNAGVSTIKSSNETAAYKYQTDEAKAQLLNQANSATNRLLAFLTKNATVFAPFAPNTDYKAGAVVFEAEKYYTANVNFTSGATFVGADWTEKPASEIVFSDWTNSDTRRELKALLFTDHKDFSRYYNIDNSAVFFVKARYIIQELLMDHIDVRFRDGVPTDKLPKVKRFLAYKTMAVAIVRLDVNLLPESLRGPINSEMNKKGGDVDYIREKLRANIDNKATEYLNALDMELTSEATPTAEPLDSYQQTPNADNKYYSSL